MPGEDRNRRYETANGLAADILRHLSSEPVTARPPSTLYRVQKAVRRNKLPFAVASLAAVALILAAGVSSWLALEAKRSEREARAQAVLAREQAEIARAVKEFLTNQLLRGANPFVDPVSDPNRLPLLERVARQLEGNSRNSPRSKPRFASPWPTPSQKTRPQPNARHSLRGVWRFGAECCPGNIPIRWRPWPSSPAFTPRLDGTWRRNNSSPKPWPWRAFREMGTPEARAG